MDVGTWVAKFIVLLVLAGIGAVVGGWKVSQIGSSNSPQLPEFIFGLAVLVGIVLILFKMCIFLTRVRYRADPQLKGKGAPSAASNAMQRIWANP